MPLPDCLRMMGSAPYSREGLVSFQRGLRISVCGISRRKRDTTSAPRLGAYARPHLVEPWPHNLSLMVVPPHHPFPVHCQINSTINI